MRCCHILPRCHTIAMLLLWLLLLVDLTHNILSSNRFFFFLLLFFPLIFHFLLCCVAFRFHAKITFYCTEWIFEWVFVCIYVLFKSKTATHSEIERKRSRIKKKNTVGIKWNGVFWNNAIKWSKNERIGWVFNGMEMKNQLNGSQLRICFDFNSVSLIFFFLAVATFLVAFLFQI